MSDIELRPGEAPADTRQEAPPSLRSRLRPFWAVLHDATDGLYRHDGVMVASAIAFSLVFALFPFAIFVVALGAIMGGADLASYVRAEAVALLPRHVIETLEPELEQVLVFTDRARPLTIGILVTLVSITGAVEAVRDGLNRAYGCTEDRHMVRRYLSSLAFVFLAMAFLLVLGALGVAVPIWVGIIDRFVPGPALDLGWLESGREALLVFVAAAMLFALHFFMPVRRPRLWSIAGGVFLTLAAWWLSAKVFGLYISEIANYSTTYAGLAGIVVLMFFLYIQALILLYGAEVNRSIADYRGSALWRPEA
ncbi:MAG: YihY/virulence factor BrkB family protein [Propylenella sp.]